MRNTLISMFLFTFLSVIYVSLVAGDEEVSSEIGSITHPENVKNPPIVSVDLLSDEPEPQTEAKVQRFRRFILPSRFNMKRNDEFYDDPRFFSAAFGKRSAQQDFDPRFFSSAFGKRSSQDFDPRFFSSAFGKRSSQDLDPRFFSSAFGKRSRQGRIVGFFDDNNRAWIY